MTFPADQLDQKTRMAEIRALVVELAVMAGVDHIPTVDEATRSRLTDARVHAPDPSGKPAVASLREYAEYLARETGVDVERIIRGLFPRKTPAELGRVAYQAYGDARQWKAFNGDRMPAWDQLHEDMQTAWAVATIAAHGAAIGQNLKVLTAGASRVGPGDALFYGPNGTVSGDPGERALVPANVTQQEPFTVDADGITYLVDPNTDIRQSVTTPRFWGDTFRATCNACPDWEFIGVGSQVNGEATKHNVTVHGTRLTSPTVEGESA